MSIKIEEIKSKVAPSGYKLYNKLLIQEIVKQVELGLPRQEIVQKYGVSKSSIEAWMSKYGSDQYHDTKRQKYSKTLKRQVVAAIKTNRMSYEEAKIAYNIKNIRSIRSWVKFSYTENDDICIVQNDLMAKASKRPQDATIEELRSALKLAELKLEALNTLIDIAEDQLKIDIRKKSGAKQSPK